MRMFYSRFFGLDHFSANFSNLGKFLNWFMCFSVFNIFFVLIPIILVDIFGMIALGWGSQLFIMLLESLILSIIMIIFTLIEFKTSRSII